MHQPTFFQAVVAALALLVLAGSVAVWTVAAIRWFQRQPVLPYQPRRPVPWQAIDVAVVLAAYIMLPPLVMYVSQSWFGIEPPKRAVIAQKNQGAEHPVARVLIEQPSLTAVLVSVALASVAAPLVEELVFRLLLQGWLEALERRTRRWSSALRHFTAGFLPLLLVSFLFAAMHYRGPEPVDTPTIVYSQAIQFAANLLTIAVLILWLRISADATLDDLGIVPAKLFEDIKLGLLGFLAVIGPIYGVALLAKALLPQNLVVDPLPIFFLALALGILYYRTHRILPAIVLHMAFNTTGVLLALAVSN